MQDRDGKAALHRRTLLTGVGGLAVATAVAGCRGGASSTAAAATTLGPVADVPVGSGKVYAEQRVVVTQPVEGTFHAFSAVCTHQGCTLKAVSDSTINCACHGSRFAIDDGSVSRGPAQQPLARLAVAVEAGSLTLR